MNQPLPLAAAQARLGRPGRPRKPQPEPQAMRVTTSALAPRLLDLEGTASYLALSTWSVRDLEASGVLRRVRVPLPHGGELRKLLFDVRDLDTLIERWKDDRT